MTLRVHHARADGHELQHVGIPLQPLDLQPHANDAVRAHVGSLGAHARYGQLPRLVHSLREHIHLLVLVPAGVLDAEVVDAGADAQADRLEARLAHQQELVDREIRGEHSTGVVGAAQPFQPLQCVLRDGCRGIGHQITPSWSLSP